jgi:hypothetical protein
MALYKRQLEEPETFEDQEKKAYLTGVIEQIQVHKNTNNAHRLVIQYKLPIVGGGIKYQRADGKRTGPYDLIDGTTEQILENLTLTWVYDLKKSVISYDYGYSTVMEQSITVE